MNITKRIVNLKWQWAGHLVATKHERWTENGTEWRTRHGRRCDRLRQRWEDDLDRIAENIWMRLAGKRRNWRVKLWWRIFNDGLINIKYDDPDVRSIFLLNCFLYFLFMHLTFYDLSLHWINLRYLYPIFFLIKVRTTVKSWVKIC